MCAYYRILSMQQCKETGQTQVVMIAVHDISLSFLYYIYNGDRKCDNTSEMHHAKWYLAQTTQNAPLNADMHDPLYHLKGSNP